MKKFQDNSNYEQYIKNAESTSTMEVDRALQFMQQTHVFFLSLRIPTSRP